MFKLILVRMSGLYLGIKSFLLSLFHASWGKGTEHNWNWKYILKVYGSVKDTNLNRGGEFIWKCRLELAQRLYPNCCDSILHSEKNKEK